MIGENAILRDGKSAGFAEGLRIAGKLEGARIEGLSLNVSGADKQETIGSKRRTTAWSNVDSILFGFAQHSQFDSVWLRQLTGDVEEVLAVGEEMMDLRAQFRPWLRRVAGEAWPPEAAICEIGPKFCLQKRMMPAGLQSPHPL